MKIAVTNENGEIFQHFGHTKAFKIYQVQQGKVTGFKFLFASDGGHSALSGLLARN